MRESAFSRIRPFEKNSGFMGKAAIGQPREAMKAIFALDLLEKSR
jgi:hypothetical protein